MEPSVAKVYKGKTQEEDKTYRLSPRPCEAGPNGQNRLSLNKENDIPNDKGEDNNYIMIGTRGIGTLKL